MQGQDLQRMKNLAVEFYWSSEYQKLLYDFRQRKQIFKQTVLTSDSLYWDLLHLDQSE